GPPAVPPRRGRPASLTSPLPANRLRSLPDPGPAAPGPLPANRLRPLPEPPDPYGRDWPASSRPERPAGLGEDRRGGAPLAAEPLPLPRVSRPPDRGDPPLALEPGRAHLSPDPPAAPGPARRAPRSAPSPSLRLPGGADLAEPRARRGSLESRTGPPLRATGGRLEMPPADWPRRAASSRHPALSAAPRYAHPCSDPQPTDAPRQAQPRPALGPVRPGRPSPPDSRGAPPRPRAVRPAAR